MSARTAAQNQEEQPMMVLLIVILLIALLIAGWGATAYNRLIATRNGVSTAFAQVDVQLRRRHDLIPNLVETAKGYMKHEQDTLSQVTAARSAAIQAQAQTKTATTPTDGAALAGLANAEAALGGVLGRLMALVENYPDLKANQTMLRLQDELSNTEEQIAIARQAFNDRVFEYNTPLQSFPTNLLAANFGFRPAQLWEIQDTAAREAPEIRF